MFFPVAAAAATSRCQFSYVFTRVLIMVWCWPVSGISSADERSSSAAPAHGIAMRKFIRREMAPADGERKAAMESEESPFMHKTDDVAQANSSVTSSRLLQGTEAKMVSAAKVAEQVAKAVKASGGSPEQEALAFGMAFEKLYSSNKTTPAQPQASGNIKKELPSSPAVKQSRDNHSALEEDQARRQKARSQATANKRHLIIQGHTQFPYSGTRGTTTTTSPCPTATTTMMKQILNPTSDPECMKTARQAAKVILGAEEVKQAELSSSQQENYTMPSQMQFAYEDFVQFAHHGGYLSACDIASFETELAKASTKLAGRNVTWNTHDQAIFAMCFLHLKSTVEYESEVSAGQQRRHVVQGDMLELKDKTTGASLIDIEGHIKAGHRYGGHLWDDSRRINYCFSAGISDQAHQAVLAAIGHVEEQVPCIDFHQTELDPYAYEVEECQLMPSIIFQSKEEGCWSYVGQVSGKFTEYMQKSQEINIGTGCEIMGIVVHEIGHVLGMLHEMARSDRDTYLTVNYENVQSGMEAQFDKSSDAYGRDTFDILSLMMYSAYAFSIGGGKLTLEPKDSRVVEYLGQRLGFSENDVLQVGTMYSCKDEVTPITHASSCLSQKLLNGELSEFSGECADSAATGYRAVGDDGQQVELTCDQLAKMFYCDHQEHAKDIKSLCPISCCLCFPKDQPATEATYNVKGAAERCSPMSAALMTILLVAKFLAL
jgi:hypothetical protein